ncbi:hypothetical protein SSX86_007213 [Deinandra increscens subsp. villosa]|uniref:Phosphoribosyltransferase domain-containing protein n=1 Tax=Deinandra increscens subsp. villosa TaxID=3103831 RepID=A0AAP0DK69_9ASTR
MEEKSSAEVFHGFQTINSCRSGERDRFLTGLATPEFTTYVENKMKNEISTKYLVRLASKKLEKVLNTSDNYKRLPETTKVIKQNRITLSELFQKTKMSEKMSIETKSNNIIKLSKHKISDDKSSVHLKPKRRRSASVRTDNIAYTTVSADDKLHKILEMVHFEALANISEDMRRRKYVNEEEEEEGYRNRRGHKMVPQDIIIAKNQTKSKVSHATNAKREHWIKSDADLVIDVATGAFFFLDNLLHNIKFPLTLDFVRAKFYGSRTVSSGAAKISCDVKLDVAGKHVILVEDIVDTGNTVSHLISYMEARGATSVSVCTLLDKPARRTFKFQLLGVGKFFGALRLLC